MTKKQLIEKQKDTFRKQCVWLAIPDCKIDELLPCIEKLVDNSKTAGRNAEGRRLLDILEARRKREANTYDVGYNQALTDIKNHLTE